MKKWHGLTLVILGTIIGFWIIVLSTILRPPKAHDNGVNAHLQAYQEPQSLNIAQDKKDKYLSVYRNPKLGITFKYLKYYLIMDETDTGITLGAMSPLTKEKIPYLTISKNHLSNPDALTVCETGKNEPTVPCLILLENDGIFSNVTIADMPGIRFQILDADGNTNEVLQTHEPKYEFKMNLSGHGLKQVFEGILESVEFL